MQEENEFLQIPQEIQAQNLHPKTPSHNPMNQFAKIIDHIHNKSSINTQIKQQVLSQKKFKAFEANKITISSKQKNDKIQNTSINDEEYIRRYNKLNSIILDKSGLAAKHIQNEVEKKSNSYQKLQILKLQHIQDDKGKFPLKYKICCEHLGYEEEQVYKLKPYQIRKIEESYIKKKGNQYLRQNKFEGKVLKLKENSKQQNKQADRSSHKDIRMSRSKTQNSSIGKQGKKEYKRNYVHQIFADLSAKMKIKEEREKREQVKKEKKEKRLLQMNEREQLLGQIIYHRLSKYKIKSRGQNILNLYRDEENIDSTLIAIIRTKIKKAQLSMQVKK